MNASLAIAINTLLVVGIVAAIVSLLGWGIVAHRRDERQWAFMRRRCGSIGAGRPGRWLPSAGVWTAGRRTGPRPG